MNAVVSHIWESTVFGAAAAAFTLMFRRNRAAVRHAIWLAASVKFLLPFAALAAVWQWLPAIRTTLVTPAGLAGAVFESSASVGLSASYANGVIFVWMTGALLVAAYWSAEWRRVIARVRREAPVADGPVRDALTRVSHACGVTRPITLVITSASAEPGVFGLWRPVLLWPSHLSALRSDQIEGVLAHEVAHVARRDNFCASIHMLVSALFWFHPLVWWIGTRLIDERERACDERVLGLGLRPATYAGSILETCRLCISSTLANVPGVTGGNLSQRISHIMSRDTGAPLGRWKKIAVTAALLFAVLPAMKADAPAPAQDSDETVQAGPDIEMPHLIREVKPQYTPRAIQEKVQGEVLMECIVRTNGKTADIKVVRSLDPDLDQAAVDAASQWVFEPGKRKGKPVNVQVTIAVAFTLKD